MNVIEFPLDRVRNPEREAASNEPDAKNPANEARVQPTYAVGANATEAERLQAVRTADREEAERLIRRNRMPFEKREQANGDDLPKAPKAAPGPATQNTNSIKAAPVFAKSGYEIPKSVAAQYVAFEGKFLDRKSETVHFEDKGRVLSTESNDRTVIAHMVEVAKAKSWGELNLKGTEEFRREAWMAAELAGLQSRGFKPTPQDHARLQVARETMRIGAGEKKPDAAERAVANILEFANAAPLDRSVPKTERVGPTNQEVQPQATSADTRVPRVEANRPPSPPSSPAAGAPAASSPSTEQPSAPGLQERPGVTAGVLLEHGPARFEHNPKKNPSYFVKVETAAGERTVWGKDLERAVAESRIQVGQRIELEKSGSKPALAVERKFDEQGREVEAKTIETQRNAWQATSSDAPKRTAEAVSPEVAAYRDEQRRIAQTREAFLRGELPLRPEQQQIVDAARERIKEAAARSVMEEAIKGLPAQAQETVRGEFEGAVADARANNRPLDVPMPRVSEQTIEKVRAEIAREQGVPERNQEERAVAEHVISEHDAPSLELDY
jgi:hypothetical protein